MNKIIPFFLSLLLFSPVIAEETTPLGKHMDEMSGLLKSLRRIDDFDEKAATVRKAQDELLKCFAYLPALTEKTTDPAQKALEIALYKKLLAQNYVLLCDYETAFLNKDEDAADEIYSQLKKIKKDGHSNYIEQD